MWFRKRKNLDTKLAEAKTPMESAAPIKDRTAAVIATGIVSFQVILSRRLALLDKKCSQAQRKIALFLFCGIVSCYLFFSLRDALFNKSTVLQQGGVTSHGAMNVPPILPSPVPKASGDTVIIPIRPDDRP